jgi:hypothetical protein
MKRTNRTEYFKIATEHGLPNLEALLAHAYNTVDLIHWKINNNETMTRLSPIDEQLRYRMTLDIPDLIDELEDVMENVQLMLPLLVTDLRSVKYLDPFRSLE